MRINLDEITTCIACGESAPKQQRVPLCRLCYEDVSAGGDTAIGRIAAILQFFKEREEYVGDARIHALQHQIQTLEQYIEQCQREERMRAIAWNSERGI